PRECMDPTVYHCHGAESDGNGSLADFYETKVTAAADKWGHIFGCTRRKIIFDESGTGALGHLPTVDILLSVAQLGDRGSIFAVFIDPIPYFFGSFQSYPRGWNPLTRLQYT
ncbi:MAG: hypothetical protein L6R42_009757, partial [Xanthoria sp. 1 TBL-2021]